MAKRRFGRPIGVPTDNTMNPGYGGLDPRTELLTAQIS